MYEPTWWLPLLAIPIVALLAWWASRTDWVRERRASLIAHAEQQHAAYMDGNEELGLYGDYPPAKLEPYSLYLLRIQEMIRYQ